MVRQVGESGGGDGVLSRSEEEENELKAVGLAKGFMHRVVWLRI